MLGDAVLSVDQIEFKMLSQLQVKKTPEQLMQTRLLSAPIKSFEFTFNPVTFGFIMIILKSFGLIQFKID